MFPRRKMFLIIGIILLMFVHPFEAMSEIIFSDDYNSIVDGWNCSDPVPAGYSGQSGCSPAESINGVMHYPGEITSGGRTGNSLKLWRSNGIWTSYDGYLNKEFTSTEFNNQYKELFARWYVKIDPDWDASLSVAQTHKLNRFYRGTAAGARSSEWLMDVKGPTFKTGKFSFYALGGGGVKYTENTVTELGINDGQWHSLEWHVKLNTSTGSTDGELNFWVDGRPINICDGTSNCETTKIGNFGATTDQFFTTVLVPAIGNLTDGTWSFPTDGWYSIEFDDFAVSTTYIGPEGGTPPAPDNEDPSKPTSLQDTGVLSTQVDISWNASTDNIGVTGYNIFRDGIKVGSSGVPSYSDNSVIPSATYSYSVSAFDAAVNESDLSDAIQVTTPESSYNSILLETWENNNIDNWDDDLIVGDTHIDTDPVHAGSYALKMEASGEGNYGNYAHFFGDHPGVDGAMVTDVTVEEYIFLSPDFLWPSSDMKIWLMNSFESWYASYSVAEGQAKPHKWAPYYMTISVNSSGQPFGQMTRADGLGETGDLWHNYWQNTGTPVALVPGTWNKLKFRLKLNSLGNSDGIFQLWVNDELKCDYGNMNFRGNYPNYGWNHLMISMDPNPLHPQSQWSSRDNISIFSGVGIVLQLSPPSSFRLK